MLDQALSKQDLWTHRINDYRSSYLIAQEWCINNKLSLSTFRYWIFRLNKKQTANEDNSNTVFAELPVHAETPFFGAAPVTIHIGTIRIEINISPSARHKLEENELHIIQRKT